MSVSVTLRYLLSGEERPYEVPTSNEATVGDIIRSIGEEFKVVVLFEGKELEEDTLLMDMGIANDDVLELKYTAAGRALELDDRGYQVDAPSMTRAVRSNDINSISMLLEEGIPCSPYAYIHHACVINHTTLLKLLLANGASADVRNSDGETPLITAGKHGSITCMMHLLRAGANSSLVCFLGRTAMHYAHKWNGVQRSDAIRCFPEEVLRKGDRNGRTPLHHAIMSSRETGSDFVYRSLFTRFNDLRAEDKEGNTAAHLACRTNNTHALKFILRLYPHCVNERNKAGDTPLHIAAMHGHRKCASNLVTLGVRPHYDWKNGEGLTPLDVSSNWAVRSFILDSSKDSITVSQKQAQCGCALM
eukprot:TRINITY_DN722_c1_g1_i1.p1 TRINITY_DN722_c1_g1~~TRINITY_DN722_c1_g1_i1.p1  ORF type:complete len:390 (+),score=80.23 TRINITY_DN722_c1_g1_i1:90-1172(+)